MSNFRLIIDADGCPVVSQAIKIAKDKNIHIIIVKNYAHEIYDDYAEIVTVDISSDAADYYIANHTRSGDIIITQDYGLSAMVLSKGGLVLTQNGLIISDNNIEDLLYKRHMNKKLRQEKRIYTKASKRTKDQDDNFVKQLLYLINKKQAK